MADDGDGPWAEIAPLVAEPGGHIGTWFAETGQRPAFRLDTPSGATPEGPLGEEIPREVWWHQVGNAHLLATAHAGGWIEVWSTARGMVRLIGRQSTWGPVGWQCDALTATWLVNGARWTGCAARSDRIDGDVSAPQCEVVRRVTLSSDEDDAALMIEVEVEGPAGFLPSHWEERWVPEVDHLLVGALMSPSVPPPSGYGWRSRTAWRTLYGISGITRKATLGTRRLVGRWLSRPACYDGALRAIVHRPRHRLRPAHRSAAIDLATPVLLVGVLDGGREVVGHGSGMILTISAEEQAAGRAVVRLAVVLGRDGAAAEAALTTCRNAVAASEPSLPVSLTLPRAPWLARETAWHGAYLLGARQYDDHFRRAYVSQGSAYGFAHGLQGAPRDYAIFSVPLAFVDPDAARDLIRVMLALTRRSGGMHYAHFGRGRPTSGGVHAAPTDLPIFLLWALTEYVWTTGDRAFLDEIAPYASGPGSDAGGPVIDRVVHAWTYLRDRVGLGPHGLLRVGSGDWNDPISAMVPDRKRFHDHGESMFNTAFACYVLPRAADLIADRAPAHASEMRSFATSLRAAAERHAWNGRWFLRGFDGAGAPIGDEHLFVDSGAWTLISELGTGAQRRVVMSEMQHRCDDPSPIGATILDRPHPVRLGMLAPGWDCNGGVWAAVNAFLAWGYALHDPDLAWRLVAKQSLAAHATAYPDLWLGVWSGPDAYNAHFGSYPGHTFVQPATPMAEFPVMNANAHAGPLLALMRTLGVETSAKVGLHVAERGRLPWLGSWSLRGGVGTASPQGVRRSEPEPAP